VVTGSYNYLAAAEHRNAENPVVIRVRAELEGAGGASRPLGLADPAQPRRGVRRIDK
jgi:hypothetical protein